MPAKSLSQLRDLVGESVRTVEDLTIEAGKVEEFARAVGDENPAFRDDDAARRQGFDTVPAPLTFTRVSYFPRHRVDGVGFDWGFDLGFDDERVVHGEQAYEFERPVTVGETLYGVTTLTDVYQREGSSGGTMTFAVLETEYFDEADERVLVERLTRIETGRSDSGGDQE